MNPLSREAIATAPEFTNRTPFALVVDAFLVRATDDAIRHRNGQHTMPVHEFQNLSRYAGVGRGCHHDRLSSRESLRSLRFRTVQSRQRPRLPGSDLVRRTQSSPPAIPAYLFGLSCAEA